MHLLTGDRLVFLRKAISPLLGIDSILYSSINYAKKQNIDIEALAEGRGFILLVRNSLKVKPDKQT